MRGQRRASQNRDIMPGAWLMERTDGGRVKAISPHSGMMACNLK